jgi:hypothetical protein
MIALYRRGEFQAAAAALAEARRLAPELLNWLYDLYEARLSALIESPPENWDGVVSATRK